MSDKNITSTKPDTDCSAKTRSICTTLCNKMLLPGNFNKIIDNIYLPLGRLIIEKKQCEPLLVSINGAQGTGKSTFTTFIKEIIESEYNYNVAAFSLDDFYLTRALRKQLSHKVHPLLKTRGVPGTHDINLLENVLNELMKGDNCSVPVFDKAKDDRCPEIDWIDYDKNIDIILFEGWCNNSPLQNTSELNNPINELEENEDKQGIWRTYANEKLDEYHRRIFTHTDMSIMLKAPDFNHIYNWRNVQEQKLKVKTAISNQSHIMSQDELTRFIQHFERITRHTLNHLPENADIVIPINADRSINSILQKI